MTDVVQKGHGLRFAEQLLKSHGWKEGKGLGRDENGISEPVKVKVKCNKGGVGHQEGEQFTFQWWDHVFNKASSSLQVESHQDGISLKKTENGEEEDGGVISNKKPRKASLAKGKIYGSFVKSATLLSGQPGRAVDSDSSSSEQEEDKLDLSSIAKLSDCNLMKACGGRTAHKGARHGLKMSAKLARLEQQEAEFMAKYGKKTEDRKEGIKTKNEKTSKEKTEELNVHHVSLSEPTDIKIKKKKKKRTDEEEETTRVENGHENHKRKQKKKKNGEFPNPELDVTPLREEKKKREQQVLEEETQQSNHVETLEHQVKKKRKKSKKDSNICEEPQASPPTKKKKKSKE
ncbi:G patch domain-containing protein 4 [Syngnathus typhle]|uniref:G patch domain-containing protein 4 n=1 Tax=Syngnathus typhle TaxID=161592 RepID=UPI002A6B6FF3|nr:G patch domain-containing protein 4 [Syngnathus typhle]XP_061146185.1 G patch domain-containing protein 4 [Syngnathus typhle]